MGPGERPVEDKEALIERLREAIDQTTAFCAERGVEIAPILQSEGFERVRLMDDAMALIVYKGGTAGPAALIDDAVEDIIVNDELKARYLALAAEVERLYRAILPDTRAGEFSLRRHLFGVLAAKIRNLTPPADISDIVEQVEDLLDESISAQGYVIRETGVHYDLTKIDFEALRQQFARSRKRTEAERLRGSVHAKLQRMVRLNRTRMDFLEEYQRLIEEYNAGSRNVEEFFKQLVDLAQRLNEEEQRAIALGLSEEELAVFDLLTRPGPDLAEREEQEVRRIARGLLTTLCKEKLVLDWRKRQQSRAAVRVFIEDMIWQLPDRYTDESCQEKSAAIYQHIYDNYWGADRSIYSQIVAAA